jgi:NADH dehydrogenase
MSGAIVITGAFSYTGKYATRLLLDRGYEVRTLTNRAPALHPERVNPFGNGVQVFPCNFDRPDELLRSMEGASTLINTYWVRFPRGDSTFATAVRNTRTLIDAARHAGVRRIVHVSIANPSLQSPLGYYRGKAEVEEAIVESGLSYSILRPTVIFGREDILINNIAWFVRQLPVFGIPGDGRYAIRPIYVEDMAQLLASAVDEKGNSVVDAVGPETFSFKELVTLIAEQIGRPARLVPMPAFLVHAATRAAGWLVGDVVLTWEEYKGLMSNLLASQAPATGPTRLSEWLAENGDCLGRQYASEVARHVAKAKPTPKAHGGER